MALSGRARNTRILVVSLVMASLLIITLDYRGGQRGPFEAAGRATYAVVGAVQSAVSRVLQPIGAFASGVAHIGALRSENAALKQQVRALQAEAGKTVSLQRVNDDLRRLVGLKDSLHLKGVTARVIAESVGNFEWSITINLGSSSGVRVDMPVVVGDGLVGHVTEVSFDASKVQLIIDPSSSVAGRLGDSGDTGLLVGQRSQDLTMNLVSPSAKITPNEQVVTAGYQGGLYPPEIPVGVVSHIYQVRGGLTSTINVRPAVDFTALEFVFVVSNQ